MVRSRKRKQRKNKRGQQGSLTSQAGCEKTGRKGQEVVCLTESGSEGSDIAKVKAKEK